MKTIQHVVIILLLLFSLSAPVAATSSKININTATVEELCQLKRIGPKYAQRIIEYRETNGAFEAPDEITNVRGIGLKTFEANKEIIIISDEPDVETVAVTQ